jgi:hypothetical protein
LEQARQADETRAVGAANSPGQSATQLSADFECGFAPNAKKISDTHFVLDMENKYEYMFLFKLTGVAGKTIRIDCRNIPLDKWRSLNPVYRYANDGLPELAALLPDSYKLTDAKTTKARNGALLPDGTGEAWHFAPEVWATGGNTLSFVQTFEKDEVTVAMKTPFTLEDEKLLCAEAAKCPDAKVIDVGKTPEGRMLHVIKVSTGGEQGEKTHPCILMYAREHADEHDSSWALAGALWRVIADDLLAHNLRANFSFLFVPILDADAAAKCVHESIIATFDADDATPESTAYGRYFQSWMRQRKSLDVVLNLHNVESSESAHLVAADWPPEPPALSKGSGALHDLIRNNLMQAGFVVPAGVGHLRFYESRMSGWLSGTYGTLPILYENNSQEPHRHLSTQELAFVGQNLLISSTKFLASGNGLAFERASHVAASNYASRWELYAASIDENNPFVAESLCLAKQHADELLLALSEQKREGSK